MTESKLISKLSVIDLDNIDVENVRSILNVSTRFARFICETSVKFKIFEKNINVCCANSDCERILITHNSEKEFTENYYCMNCELLEKDKFDFNLEECSISITYKYIAK